MSRAKANVWATSFEIHQENNRKRGLPEDRGFPAVAIDECPELDRLYRLQHLSPAPSAPRSTLRSASAKPRFGYKTRTLKPAREIYKP